MRPTHLISFNPENLLHHQVADLHVQEVATTVAVVTTCRQDLTECVSEDDFLKEKQRELNVYFLT